MTDNIKNYWKTFCTEKNIPIDTPYEAWAFGNTKEMADDLANLVDKKIKTATTSAYELYENDDPLPKAGEYNIILNGSNEPVCVTQTKLVYVMPYYLISPEHAWHEGEGDRSYDYWRKVHDRFFEKEYQRLGKTFYEQAPMLCEVFEKVS
ncbi:ASCH domain-containing protein [Streptococcus zalophi]|uniref:ASCH domain-containing protein n=1 Tax=Streptococcus zalophi TaxID=640031 RepID=A0A934PBS1_9STRE|nr:ASCH domain-containing protein [Streptococcus zalophi]MBJ8350300.1 ASCH domain-containing protein [Streptococcus zalophi]